MSAILRIAGSGSEQIALRPKKEYPNDPSMHVSHETVYRNKKTIFTAGLVLANAITFGSLLAYIIPPSKVEIPLVFALTFTALSLILTAHSIFTLFWWMLYAWEDPELLEKNQSPTTRFPPHLSFSAIIPARHEEKVIRDTITAVANIAYPEARKEVLVVCRSDDSKTIEVAKQAIRKIQKPNIKLIVFADWPINKPHALNVGLRFATKDIICVFDAEDEPAKDIYSVINTVMTKEKADVVQSAVQLIDYHTSWYALLNVLEYFFWFKSTLLFFSKMGLVPLGGNTVFFRKAMVEKVGGWDETCLTEDCDIGIRLSAIGAKIHVTYNAQHATLEETPPTLQSFIRQRTRWNQGFMQVFMKGDWLQLKRVTQKLLACYILLWPEMQAILFLYLFISILTISSFHVPVVLAMASTLPTYILFLQLVMYSVGFYEFTKSYGYKYPILAPCIIFVTFYPFQLVLGFSALRAVIHLLLGTTAWEKTTHVNSHRAFAPSLMAVNSNKML